MDDKRWSAVDDYLAQTIVAQDDALDAALAANEAAGLPPIDVSAAHGKMLHLLARIAGARKALEIGLLGGYSTIWIARALPADGKLVTLEANERHAVGRASEHSKGGPGRPGRDSASAPRWTACPRSRPRGSRRSISSSSTPTRRITRITSPGLLRLSRPGTTIVVDNVVRDGRILDARSSDHDVVGVRRMFEMMKNEPRLSRPPCRQSAPRDGTASRSRWSRKRKRARSAPPAEFGAEEPVGFLTRGDARPVLLVGRENAQLPTTLQLRIARNAAQNQIVRERRTTKSEMGTTIMKLKLLMTTVTVSLISVAPSFASTGSATWTLSGTDTGSGTLTFGAADNGGFDILTFSGTIDGFSVSLLGGQPGWLPGPVNFGTPPGVTAAPEYSTYGLTYDNIFYPGNSPDIPCFGPTTTHSNQYADAFGILFNYDGAEGEIWGNGTHGQYIFGPPGLYTFEVASGIQAPADYSTNPYTPQVAAVSYYQNTDVFTVAVPEPSTWAMLALGFAGVGFAGRRGARMRAAVV